MITINRHKRSTEQINWADWSSW